MQRLLTLIFVLLASLAMAIPAMAESFPSKPITYSIPFEPGGQSDVEARRQQPMLEKALGVRVLVQYKPGGGGSVGWADLVQQKADGYFMTGINIPHIVLQPLLRGNAGYKTDQLVPVALFQTTPIGLAVLKDSPFKTLKDFVEYAKKNPGAVVCGGSGTGAGHDTAHIQLSKMAGITMTYLPYKGAAPAVAAFLGGHVQALWGNSNDLLQHKDKLRVLAFGTDEPFSPMPDAPSFKSQGYNLLASIDRGVAVPPGTPADKIAVIEKAFLSIANDPKVRAQMLSEGFVPMSVGSSKAKVYIQGKVKEWTPLVPELQSK
ncbi:MAG: tripartite tricarboxylate transporter substrate binding protein [Desulfocurvibacter africanus]